MTENPWRSVMMVELGKRVVTKLMTEDDWTELVKRALDAPDWTSDLALVTLWRR